MENAETRTLTSPGYENARKGDSWRRALWRSVDVRPYSEGGVRARVQVTASDSRLLGAKDGAVAAGTNVVRLSSNRTATVGHLEHVVVESALRPVPGHCEGVLTHCF